MTVPLTEAPRTQLVHKFRIRAVLFLVAAVLAGVGAVLLVKVYIDQARRSSASSPVPLVDVVVAATDLPAGQRLEPAHVRIVRWPAAHAPAGRLEDASAVVGQTLRQAMVAGEPLLRDRIAGRAQGQGLAAILDAGARAMAVKVDQVIGIAGFVQPGDRVDVVTTIALDDEARAVLDSKAEKMSKIILQNIRVLAVGEHLDTQGQRPVKVQVVTLEVRPDESERLALASQYGKVQLTMRSRADRDDIETEGVTPLGLMIDAEDRTAMIASVATASPVETPSPRRRPRRVTPRQPPPPPPPSPVVEILRGTSKVEERTLRATGGQP